MGFIDRLRANNTGTSPRTTRSADPRTPLPDRNGFYGRRFRTPSGVDECEANLNALLGSSPADSRRFDAVWTGAEPAPDVLYGIDNTDYGVVYIAIWQTGTMVAGQREVAFVPTRFDGEPVAIAGQWKLRDPELASIGHYSEFPVRAKT